jgi:hypothetical protein
MRVMSHEEPWLETGGPVGIFSPPFSPESHSTNVSGLGSASEPVKPALELRALTAAGARVWLTLTRFGDAVPPARGGDGSREL